MKQPSGATHDLAALAMQQTELDALLQCNQAVILGFGQQQMTSHQVWQSPCCT